MLRSILVASASTLVFSGHTAAADISLEVRLGQSGNGIYPDIQSALDDVAKLDGYSSATITVRAGRYLLSQPIRISMASLAAGTMKLTLQGAQNESVQISGAASSVSSGWQATSHPRIVESPTQGCQYKALYSSDGNARQRSRHPNTPYYYTIEGKPDASLGIVNSERAGFRYAQGISAAWDFAKVEVVGLQMYRAPRMKIKRLYPADGAGFKTVEFTTAAQASFDIADYSNQLYSEGYRYRFYVENVPEVDAPGEWYCDAAKNKLRYFLQSDESFEVASSRIVKSGSGTPLTFSIPNGKFVGSPLMTVGESGSPQRNVVIQGFNIIHTDWAAKSGADWDAAGGTYLGAQALSPPQRQDYFLSPAVRLYCDGCVVQWNTLANLGGSGVELHGVGNLVKANRIAKVGGNGVIIGDRFEGNLSHGNRIEGNVLDGIGLVHNEGVGIISYLGGGNVVTKNTIRNVAYSGISAGFDQTGTVATPDNEISFNDIQSVMLTLNDGAGIYVMGNQPNSKINNNYVGGVQINRHNAPESLYGLYFDKDSANMVVSDNFIGSSRSGSIKASKATNLQFENNYLVADAQQPSPFISTFDRGVHGSGNKVLRNIMYLSAGAIGGPWIKDADRSVFQSNYNVYYDAVSPKASPAEVLENGWLLDKQSRAGKVNLSWGVGPSSVVLSPSDLTRNLGIRVVDFSAVGAKDPVGAEASTNALR